MDGRMKERIRALDPLTAGVAAAPDPARLDAAKERAHMNAETTKRTGWDPRTGRRTLAPLAAGVVALSVVVLGGWAGRPAPALAFDGTPTPVTDAQRDAARTICAEAIESAATDPSVRIRLAPEAPVALPPLAALELHGTGAVAVFADESAVGICMLVSDGDGWVRGPVVLESNTTQGPGSTEPNVFGGVIDGTSFVIVGGTAPEGAVTMRLEGGRADGATATVQGGGYGIWLPSDDYYPAPELVALDAAGVEIARTSLEAQGKGDGRVSDPAESTRTPQP